MRIILCMQKPLCMHVACTLVTVCAICQALNSVMSSWMSSWELHEIFCNCYDLDELREWLLLKESYTIYYLLATGKLPRKNNSLKIVCSKFQMIVMRLSLKEPLGMGQWSRYSKKLNFQQKYPLTKCCWMTSSTWLITVYIQSHTRNWF